MTASSLKESIRNQREKLTGMLSESMHDLGVKCSEVIASREQLESLLHLSLPALSYCKHLYVMDADGVQITNNIIHDGEDASHLARNRMDRPYMQGIIGTTDFKLSEAYISRNKKRPSFTAVQVLRNPEGERVGFLGADFDLRELPDIEQRYIEPDNWRQVKVTLLSAMWCFINSELTARWISILMKCCRL